MLQTELEANKNLNDTLEKENVKQSKKIKKLTGLMDKANIKIESLESSLNSLQEKNASAEQGLKVKIKLRTLTQLIRFAV
jgi:glycine cleavage system regulatory protein